MSDGPRYIWVARDTWAPLSEIVSDARKRAEALANAKCCGARRKYLALVHVFAEHDAATGATPLITRIADEPPPRRRRISHRWPR